VTGDGMVTLVCTVAERFYSCTGVRGRNS